ncbi:hypothetical protein RRG08_050806 [Elysia crispata]|uniref:15-hydroxyprostaglandin dehydrogenase [NAD(+)] n=1 Tax=Elysia crispata TaxID=231223 RepID=A0AAE0YGR5_9GAST|nr:hypothetical protein RRG08_050806 [Elysia crispata]
MSLKTKNVFLTGGAQGLGRSYIDALLAAGARAFFIDINATAGEKTEKELKEKYGKESVKFQVADCTNFPMFEEAFTAAVNFLGYVDLMVNNAGLMNESKYEEMIDLNFRTLVKGSFMAAEHMRKDKGGKGGRIINISSMAGLEDIMIVPVYSATKHAVRAFTSGLAMAPDIQQQGIEYGILCPSPAATDMFMDIDDIKVRHLDSYPQHVRKAMMAPVECIQKGFMKLVSLDQMNGAILYASHTELTFRKMDNVNLGETWPVKQEDCSTSASKKLEMLLRHIEVIIQTRTSRGGHSNSCPGNVWTVWPTPELKTGNGPLPLLILNGNR